MGGMSGEWKMGKREEKQSDCRPFAKVHFSDVFHFRDYFKPEHAT